MTAVKGKKNYCFCLPFISGWCIAAVKFKKDTKNIVSRLIFEREFFFPIIGFDQPSNALTIYFRTCPEKFTYVPMNKNTSDLLLGVVFLSFRFISFCSAVFYHFLNSLESFPRLIGRSALFLVSFSTNFSCSTRTTKVSCIAKIIAHAANMLLVKSIIKSHVWIFTSHIIYNNNSSKDHKQPET